MTKPRHLASSAALALGLLCASAAARAQEAPASPPQFPGTPLPDEPRFPGIPLPPSSPPAAPPPYPWGAWTPYPSPLPRPPPKTWYGWQILIPTLASDVLGITGLFAGGGSPASFTFAAIGLIGHGISGPIVHLAHQRPLAALGSFGLEAVLPALFIVPAVTTPCTVDVCALPIVLLLVGLPIALSAGPAIDSAALAWEDRRPSSDKAAGVTFNVAPLVLPPLRAGAAHAPAPAGVALVGTF